MHLFCAVVRTHRWLADDQKIRKNKNIYSIRVLFSNVLWNQHRKHHNVQSETRKLLQGANENSDKKQGDCPEARENVNGLSEKKKTTTTTTTKKKNQFLAPQLTIFNRLLLHLTHSPVPSTVNEEFLAKNVIFRNISPVKKKVEFLWTRNEYYAWCHVRDEPRSLY